MKIIKNKMVNNNFTFSKFKPTFSFNNINNMVLINYFFSINAFFCSKKYVTKIPK